MLLLRRNLWNVFELDVIAKISAVTNLIKYMNKS